MKISDLVANFLAERADISNDIFMVSGGGNMHLIDSIGRHNNLRYICNHHEQACAIAAEGYARTSNKIGVAVVTTGPGGTNAITGVYGAWVDSIPTMIISGQVKFETTIASQPDLPLRQLGDQELNIIDVIKPITKYSHMISDKNDVLYCLEKAAYEATSGRPGPVWIDIPLNIQGAPVDTEKLRRFVPPEPPAYDTKIDEVLTMLRSAQRPVIIAGHGIALADAREIFLELVQMLGIPVIGTFARYDIIRDDHDLAFGRYGTIGHRAANFIVQNSDFILAIGARMNIRSISYNWEYFGRGAKKAAVDIDEAELHKHTLNLDLKIHADAGAFLQDFLDELKRTPAPSFNHWLQRCRQYRQDFPTITSDRINVEDYVDSYYFFHILSDSASDDTVFVFANATASVSSFQSLKTKGSQLIIENSGCAAMGYDLPAAIGACCAKEESEIICVTGDGSLQMNLQELQTIIHYQMPIKIFVLNNEGYASIKNTQNNFFGGMRVGSDPESGVSFPDTLKLAKAYGYKTFKISSQKALAMQLKTILETDSSLICEVMLDPKEKMEPKLSSEVKPDGKIVSKPLEDMYPFLPRALFHSNMIIKPIGEEHNEF